MNVPPVGSLSILSGKHGSGKSFLLRALAASLRSQALVFTSFLAGNDLATLRQEALKERLLEWLEAGARNSPSLLMIDDIDSIASFDQQEVRSIFFFCSF